MTPGRSTDSFKELSINIQTTAYPFPLHLSLINPHSLQPSFTLLQSNSLFSPPFENLTLFHCFLVLYNAFERVYHYCQPSLSTVNRSRDPPLILNPLLQPYRLFHHFHHFQNPGPISERADLFYSSIERPIAPLHVSTLAFTFTGSSAHFYTFLYQISSIPTTLHHYQTPERISGPFDTFRGSFERSTLLLQVHRLSYTFSENFTTRFRPFSTIFDYFDQSSSF